MVEKSDKIVYDSESGSEYEDVGFEPPRHFAKVAMPAPGVAAEDKEVWLIKTPKNFPISELKTLPISFTSSKVSNSGVKAFDLDKSKFQVNEDVFSSEAAKYHIVNKGFTNRPVDRFYTIREVVSVPEINYDAVVQQRKDVEKIPNLRMRHFATGYDAKDFPEAQPSIERVVKKAKIEGEEKKDKEDKEEKKDRKDKEEKKDKKDKKDKKEKKEKKKKEKKEKKAE